MAWKKQTTKPIPENAQRLADGRVRVPKRGGGWNIWEVNDSGKMVVLSSVYYGHVTHPDGRKEEISLFPDKKTSEAALIKKQAEINRVAAGIEVAPLKSAGQPLMELAGEWLGEQEGRGRNAGHIRTERARITRLLNECGFQTVADLQAPGAGELLQKCLTALGKDDFRRIKLPAGEEFTTAQVRHLLGISEVGFAKLKASKGIPGELRGRERFFTREEAETLTAHRGRGKSARTVNGYRVTISSFCNWLKRRGILIRSPYGGAALDERKGQRKQRRALEWGECLKLAESVRAGGAIRGGMPAETRAVLYLLAFQSMLRRRALAELRPADCHLTAAKPRLAIRAETDKTGTARGIPVAPDLAKPLAKIVAKTPKGEPVFPIPETMAQVVRADLRAAGIPIRTAEGEVDFHALRHSGCSHLIRAGASPLVVAKLGGWNGLNMILKRYGHLSPEDLGEAVGGLFPTVQAGD